MLDPKSGSGQIKIRATGSTLVRHKNGKTKCPTSAYHHETERYLFLELLGLAMKLYIFAERGRADELMSG